MHLVATMADPQISKLLASVHETDSRLVSVVDEVLAKLEASKLAWRVKLPPRLVGVHPDNRGGFGVSGSEVHRLGSDIVGMGWSHAATAHAVCVEDSADHKTATFTTSLAQSSPGLGVVDPEEIKYGSLSCSHTNQFLVAALCNVQSDYDSITVAGRIDKSKLSRDTKLKEALEEGIMWLVLSNSATSLYPNLCELVQAARNSTGAIHHKENSVQILVKVQNLAVNMSKATGGTVDWNSVLRTVVQRSHASPEEAEPVLKFVQKYGGGDHGSFVKDFEAFYKMHVPAGRIVPASTFESLASLKLSAKELCPFFMTAVLKAQAACPKDKVSRNKVCNFISSSEISSLAGPRKSSMLDAEKVLQECRTIVSANNVSQQVAAACLGRLDTFVVHLVLAKRNVTFKSVEEVGAAFVKDLMQAAPAHGAISSPWSSGEASSASAAGQSQIPNYIQYDEHGEAVAAEPLSLKTHGYSEGDMVKDTNGMLFQLVSMHVDHVVLRAVLPDGQSGKQENVDYDRFGTDYRKTSAKVEVMADWADRIPLKQAAYQETSAKAYITIAMLHYSGESSSGLRINTKPVRSVFAEEAFAANKLCLVPHTNRIAGANVAGQAPVGGLECLVAPHGRQEKRKFYAMPTFGESFVAAAWAVRTTVDQEHANVTVVKKQVSVSVAGKGQPDSTVDVSLPILTNPKRIKVGEELLIYAPPAAKKEPQKQAIKLTLSAQKAKAKAKA